MDHKPIGTLAELEAKGLSPAHYASCSRRVGGQRGQFENVGCMNHLQCTLSCKDKDGPRNFGWRLIQPQGPQRPTLVKEGWSECWDCVRMMTDVRSSKTIVGDIQFQHVVQIIAVEEGYDDHLPEDQRRPYTVEIKGSEPNNPELAKTNPNSPSLTYSRFSRPITIPKFNRPGDVPELATDRMAARVADDIRKKQDKEDLEAAFAIKTQRNADADAPRGGRGPRKN